MKKISRNWGFVFFAIGFLPLLLVAFFSVGLKSGGVFEILTAAFGLVTLGVLALNFKSDRPTKVILITQVLLMALVLFESFSKTQ